MTEFRLVAYTPNGGRLGPIPAPLSSSLSIPFSDIGALTFAYDPEGPLVELLGQPMEVAAEVSTDGGQTWAEPRNARYLYLQDGRDPVEDDIWSASCPGYGRRLQLARVGITGLNSSGQREFVNQSPGAIIRTLWAEAQARGALAGMAMSGVAATDAAGTAWPTTYTVSYAPGTDLRQILQAMADNGWVDYRFNGRDLEIYVPDTTMARELTVGANPVVLRAGRDITQGPFRRTWEGLADTAYILGDDLAWVERNNPGAIKPWGRGETFVQAGGVTDPITLSHIGDRTLDQSADARVEHTFSIHRESPTKPLGDYLPGDWVWIAPTGAAPERMRVRQVTLTQSGEDTSANIVANDRFLEADIRNTRDIARLQNTGTNATSGQPSSGIGADILRPAQVTGINGVSSAYVDSTGATRASITLDWPDVLTNIDGTTTTDIQFYEVWRRHQGDVTWHMIGEFDQSNYTGQPYEPGDTWEFRIRAVDQVFNRGDFSPPYAVLTAQDVVPPPKPSTPQLASESGVLQVVWDGQTSVGNPYGTPDWKWMEVHVSDEDGFTPTQGANGPGSTWKSVIERGFGFSHRALVEGLPPGQPVFVKLIPVDTSLNVGPTSDQATITMGLPTDGLPPDIPAGWEPRIEALGVGSLIVRWDPIPNLSDATTYKVWVADETPVPMDAAHYVGHGADNAAVMLLDGVPLLPDTDYWAVVVPVDSDGESDPVETPDPARVRQADTDLISAGYVYAGTISASQIESGQLSASVALLGSISTASTGRNITMSSADGLKGSDGLGNVVFHFPTDASQGASLQADLTANSIDAIGKVSLRSSANEVKAGAKIILQKGTTPPVSAPTVVSEWNFIKTTDPFGPNGMQAGWIRGASYDPASDRYYGVFESRGTGNLGGGGWWEADANGTILFARWELDGATYPGRVLGAYRVGSVIYMVMHIVGGPGYNQAYLYLRKIDAASKAIIGDVQMNLPNDFARSGVVGYDHVNGYGLYAYPDAYNNNQARFRGFNATTGQLVAGQDFLTAVPYVDPDSGPSFTSIQRVVADGIDQFVLTSRHYTQTYHYQASNLAYLGGHAFPLPYSEIPAFALYDSDRAKWVSGSRSSGRWALHDGIFWTTGSPIETRYAAYTWYDGDTVNGTHETPMSPAATFSQYKRAKVSITVPPIPDNGGVDDPDRARIYTGYTGGGARTSMWLQVTNPVGQRTTTRTTEVFSGTNPPAASNFPDGTPGKIESSTGELVIDGGSSNIAAVHLTATGGIHGFRGHASRYVAESLYSSPAYNGSETSGMLLDPIVIPVGTKSAQITVLQEGRSASNAACYMKLMMKANGGPGAHAWVQFLIRRFHNNGDPGQSAVGMFTTNWNIPAGATSIGVALNWNVDAGGGAFSLHPGMIAIDFFD